MIRFLPHFIATGVVVSCMACTTTPTPVAIATISCKSVATLAKGMSAAITTDQLKGPSADSAISDLVKAKAVCDAGVIAAVPVTSATK